MDMRPTYDNIPWDLIIQALKDDGTPEERVQFGKWLDESPANPAIYQRIRQLWEEGLADYVAYRDTDPEQAWAALEQLLDEDKIEGENAVVMHPRAGNHSPRMMRWLVAATLVLLSGGVAIWYYQDKKAPIQYGTIIGQQKRIPLPDGTTMVLQPQTRLQLLRSYNKTDRTVILQSGTVYFDVAHDTRLPFTVDLGTASVKDIGTTFTVARTTDSISVAVTSGKIAFIEKSTGETRELAAGGSLCLYTTTGHSGELKVISTGGNSLRFDNAPLGEVLDALQRQFGKKVALEDTAMAQKRSTLHLDGESFDDCVKTICATLSLESTSDGNGGYLLKDRAQ